MSVCAHVHPIKYTGQSSKAFLLCPKGQKVARPSPYLQKGAKAPFGLRGQDSRPCPRGPACPRAKTLSLPSSRRGACTLEQWDGASWGGGDWWREMAELQEISRWIKRSESKEKPKELTSLGPPAVPSRGAGCSGCSHLRQRCGWEVHTPAQPGPRFQ